MKTMWKKKYIYIVILLEKANKNMQHKRMNKWLFIGQSVHKQEPFFSTVLKFKNRNTVYRYNSSLKWNGALLSNESVRLS